VRVPAAGLVIGGEGLDRARLSRLAASLGIEDRVRFTGFIAEASRLLSGLDLYASASRKEGLPLAILEAMACALPIVATRVPGHVDVVEQSATGLLVTPDDHRELGQAMLDLLADPRPRAAMAAPGPPALHRP